MEHFAQPVSPTEERSAGPLRGAVVGFGRMGLTHFAILNTHPDVSFAGVCDSSAFMRKNITKYVGVESFEDWATMLERVEPDFLIVATPTGSHAPICRAAAERGVHIFVEKPFGLDPEEGRGVVDAMTGRDIVDQVGYVVRYNDVMLKVRELLRSGALGEIVHFKVEMYGPTVLREPKSWRAKKSQGGGCLYDFASHAVDLACYLFGEPLTVAGTVMPSIYSRNVEDALYTTLRFAGGAVGSVLVNWSDPSFRKPAYRLEILGREGRIVADLHALKVYFRGTPPSSEYNSGWNTRYVTDLAQPVRFYLRGYEFTRQLDEFVARIRDRSRTTLCSFADGLATDRVIHRIVEDAHEGAVGHG